MKVFCPLCNSRTEIKNRKDTYIYYFCKFCKVLFLSPFLKNKEISAYKNSFNYTAGFLNEKIIRTQAKHIINKLLHMNPLGKTVLDIGSGYGFFLDEAKKIGLQIYAIEPSRRLISNSNYKQIMHTFCMTFEQYQKKSKRKKYDFITLIHVVEHLKNPKQTVQSAAKLLNPGGVLYIETPNLDSHLYRVENDNYTFLTPPDHLWIFSRYCLIRFLIKKNYLIKVSTYSYPEHFMGILKAVTGHIQPRRLKMDCQINPPMAKKQCYFNISHIKYLLFDKCIAKLLYRLLNINYFGSILELYIKKK